MNSIFICMYCNTVKTDYCTTSCTSTGGHYWIEVITKNFSVRTFELYTNPAN